MKLTTGTKFRLEADVDDYKQLLQDGWAGCEDGMIERTEGDFVAVRFKDGQGWRFLAKKFPEIAVPCEWDGEIAWGD